MTDDYSTPEERSLARKAAKADKERLAQENAVISGIMATPGGRAWMHDYLAFCAVFGSTYTGEALSSAFQEGRRAVGLRLLADVMRACPDMYIQMMREQEDGGRSSNTDPRDEWGDTTFTGDE